MYYAIYFGFSGGGKKITLMMKSQKLTKKTCMYQIWYTKC